MDPLPIPSSPIAPCSPESVWRCQHPFPRRRLPWHLSSRPPAWLSLYLISLHRISESKRVSPSSLPYLRADRKLLKREREGESKDVTSAIKVWNFHWWSQVQSVMIVAIYGDIKDRDISHTCCTQCSVSIYWCLTSFEFWGPYKSRRRATGGI